VIVVTEKDLNFQLPVKAIFTQVFSVARALLSPKLPMGLSPPASARRQPVVGHGPPPTSKFPGSSHWLLGCFMGHANQTFGLELYHY